MGEWLKPIPDMPGAFGTASVGKNRDIDFMPFYRLHRRTYGIYWDLFTLAEWTLKAAAYANAQEKQRKFEAATVGFVQPGEMQPETDHNYQGEGATAVRVMDRAGRRGGKWFSLDVPVDPSHPSALIVTFNSDERQVRTFEILVDGNSVAHFHLTADGRRLGASGKRPWPRNPSVRFHDTIVS